MLNFINLFFKRYRITQATTVFMQPESYYPYYNRLHSLGNESHFNTQILCPVLSDLYLSEHDEMTVEIRAPHGQTILRLQAPIGIEWHIFTMWDSLWNSWFAKAMNLPSEEILCARFRPFGTMTYMNLKNINPEDVSLNLAALTIPESSTQYDPRGEHLELMVPTFIDVGLISRTYIFLATDLLFLRVDDEIDLTNSFVSVDIILGRMQPCGSKYLRLNLWSDNLPLSTAICLETSGNSQLLAVPWRSKFKKKSQVNNYCRKLFRWFEHRFVISDFNKPCPGKILFAEQIGERFLVEAKISTDTYASPFVLGSHITWHSNIHMCQKLNFPSFFGSQHFDFSSCQFIMP